MAGAAADYLPVVARDELHRVLLVTYNTTRIETTHMAIQLEFTLSETQAIQDRVLPMTAGALHNVASLKTTANSCQASSIQRHRPPRSSF